MKRRSATRALAQVSMLAVLFNVFLLLSVSEGHAKSDPIRIVALGDSLTAGYGLRPSEAFPAQLEKALKARGHAVEVINAGVSGDTTAAALQRLDWAIPENADAAIVALGANDALRGIEPAQARQNLDEILTKLKSRGIATLLVGMKSPHNWGEPYVKQFDAIFADLAEKHGVLLYPFFLEKVALQPALNLSDGLHPNAKGVEVIVEAIVPKVEALIAPVEANHGSAAN